MPYIDTTPALFTPKIRENNIQEAFSQLLEKHGWTTALKFKKAVPTAHLLSSDHPEEARHGEVFAIAQHYIFRNANAKMFGLAIAAQFSDFTDHENLIPYYQWDMGDDDVRKEFVSYLEGKYEDNKVGTSLYFYMVEKLPEVEDGAMLITPYGGTHIHEEDGIVYSDDDKRDMLRMALDVEVVEMDYATGESSSLYVKRAVPMTMQSPISRCTLRPDFVDSVDFPYYDTNWWADSEITMQGYIDSESIFVVMMADNVPAWESNLVPTVPFYFGNITALDEGDEAVALFTGTVPPGETEEEVAGFDFDNIATAGESIMPILKTYPKHPSNGVDTVMLSRSKFGARYQEYFLSWNVAPNEMPPAREDGDRKYPRGYNTTETNISKYQFSPSRYSNKVHTSRVYLVHPEEGVRGYLDKTIGLNSTNFSAGKLRVRQENCPEKIYDVYKYLPIGGLCPLTKRPGTPYRPMGLGIFESVLDPSNPPIAPNPSDTEPPAEVSNLQGKSGTKGEVDISWVNPTDQDFHSVSIYLGSETTPYATGIVEVGKYRLAGISAGTTTVTVKTVDINGNESTGETTDEITVA